MHEIDKLSISLLASSPLVIVELVVVVSLGMEDFPFVVLSE
jgi:hypothetical protein